MAPGFQQRKTVSNRERGRATIASKVQLQHSPNEQKKQTVVQADSQANESSPGDSQKHMEERKFLKGYSSYMRRKLGLKMEVTFLRSLW